MTKKGGQRFYLLLVLACLYFAQGLPFGLLAKALPALARDAGMENTLIGLLALPAAPWALKFLWAPWIDRLGAGKAHHRKRWIIGCQLAAAAVLVFVASLDSARLFGDRWWLLLLLLTLLNSICATQDIATDGLATRLLALSDRGIGNSIQVMGYKSGLILGGASILMLADSLGWEATLLLAASLLVFLLLPLLLWREPTEDSPAQSVVQRPNWHWWWHTLLSLFRRPHMVLWLLVLAGYRTGEDFGVHMVKPWLVDSGWSLGAIGQLELTEGLIGLLSAALCGWWLRYASRYYMLLFGAVFQVGILVGWAGLVSYPAAHGVIWLQVVLQGVMEGVAAVALMTIMMDQCRPGTEGADFTLQASVQLSVTGTFVLLSGASADLFGYQMHFLLAALLTIPVILPILLLPKGYVDFPREHRTANAKH